MSQTTQHLLMVRPVQFRMNEQTAVNNYYQDKDAQVSNPNKKAQEEFDAFAKALTEAGVNVHVVHDTDEHDSPDSIFPNNWVSFHESGDIVIYPMFAENRRTERHMDIFAELEEKGFQIANLVDFTTAEEEELFLEGTGSLILDRVHKKAYCALSPRASVELLDEWCEVMEYNPVAFIANQTVDGKRKPIYHTNVMMCIADNYAIVCLDCIDSKAEKKMVADSLTADGKKIFTISEKQVEQFAGNMLQVQTKDGTALVLSKTAHDSLRPAELQMLQDLDKLIVADVGTIERLGGGSVRCMLAEVFLPTL